jgi:hypothetical protein
VVHLEGLGFSMRAQRFAIRSRAEAVAYLAQGVLGPRLIECTWLVLAVKNRTILDILGFAGRSGGAAGRITKHGPALWAGGLVVRQDRAEPRGLRVAR